MAKIKTTQLLVSSVQETIISTANRIDIYANWNNIFLNTPYGSFFDSGAILVLTINGARFPFTGMTNGFAPSIVTITPASGYHISIDNPKREQTVINVSAVVNDPGLQFTDYSTLLTLISVSAIETDF